MLTLANALTILRVFIAAPTAWAVMQGWWSLASMLLTMAIISDYTDGRAARSRGQESAAGGLLDHSCDAIYIVAVLLALTTKGTVHILLPLLVAAAFVQYVLDSKALQGRALRTNKLGRYNGIAYFALLVVALPMNLIIPTATLQPIISILVWVLIVSTLLSMSDRLWTLLNRDTGQ